MSRPNAERWFIISKPLSRVDNWWPTTHFEQNPIFAKGFTAISSCPQISRSPNCFWFWNFFLRDDGPLSMWTAVSPMQLSTLHELFNSSKEDNIFDVRFPLERPSSKYKQHELCPQTTLWINAKIARNRIAPIAISNEASTIHFDEPQSFASTDSWNSLRWNLLKW